MKYDPNVQLTTFDIAIYSADRCHTYIFQWVVRRFINIDIISNDKPPIIDPSVIQRALYLSGPWALLDDESM